MKILKVFFLFITTFAALICKANPIEIDLPESHLVIIRPMDQWSGLTPTSRSSIVQNREKKYFLRYFDTNFGRNIASKRNIFSGPNDEGIFKKLVESFPDRIISANTLQFNLSKPAQLEYKDIGMFLDFQNKEFQNEVVKFGDPATLTDRLDKSLNTLLIAKPVTTTVSIKRETAPSESTSSTINSKNESDTNALPTELSSVIAKIGPIQNIAFPLYKSMDVRKISMGSDREGQLFIAYKSDKTLEIEYASLLAALPVLMSFEETTQDIEDARMADLERRKAIWRECVVSQKCEIKK